MSVCVAYPTQAFPTTPGFTDVDPRQQLVDLDAEIQRIEALLASLRNSRVPLKRDINRQYSTMLSLPVEICTEIFTLCYPPHHWPNECGQGLTPLTLGHVCTAWRNLAFSIPSLWSTVFLSTSSPSPVHLELLQAWLERSGQLPLSIKLDIHSSFADDQCNKVLVQLLDAFATQAHRWSDVWFSVPFFYPSGSSLCNQRPTSLPLLTSAHVALSGPSYHPLMDTFVSAPRLSKISLHNFSSSSSFILPDDQITHLTLSPTTVQDALAMLSRLPNLEQCTFNDLTRSDLINPIVIQLPYLTSLTVISSTQHSPLSELLDALELPSAKELSFHISGNSNFPHWSFTSLIQRSRCQLDSLSLNSVRVSEWQLWDCLLAVPTVRSLTLLDVPRVTQNTIKVLNPQHHARLLGGPKMLLPGLQELTYSGAMNLQAKDLVDALAQRWESGVDSCGGDEEALRRLKKLNLTTSSPTTVTGDDIERLQALAKGGMDLSVVMNGSKLV